MPDADPTRPPTPAASPPSDDDLSPAGGREAALSAVADALRVIDHVLIGVAGAEAVHGRYGLALVILIVATAAWCSGLLIDDRPRGGAR